jgi:hypothetical protein
LNGTRSGPVRIRSVPQQISDRSWRRGCDSGERRVVSSMSGWAWPIESWAERPIASAPACRHDRRSGGLPALAARLQGRERCNSLNTERQRETLAHATESA